MAATTCEYCRALHITQGHDRMHRPVSREFRCPNCARATRTVPNPFYGTGLSVSRYIIKCVACDWGQLVASLGPHDGPRPKEAAPEAPAAQPVTVAPYPRTLWARLRNRFGHRTVAKGRR